MAMVNKTPPKPLPPCPASFLAGSSLQRAFQVCKTLESIQQWPPSRADPTQSEDILLDLTPARASGVLGFALLYSPSDSGRDNLAAEILECNDDHERFAGLAHLYLYGFIGIFYNPEATTPIVPTEQSPEVSAQETVAKLQHLLEKPSLTAKDLRKLILLREDSFCPVTGREDISLHGRRAEPDSLVAAHIISQSFSEGIKGIFEGTDQKFNWAKTTGAVIERFGGYSTRVILGSEYLNSPRNAMMLAPAVHGLFGGLGLWLTPFEDHGNVITDKYEVNLAASTLRKYYRPSATFRTHAFPNGRTIEPPSTQLLALHAVCAQIAHMSGALEHLEETFRDTEPIPVMTATPYAADELVHALRKVQLQYPTKPMHV